ncbi:MAG TPA: hypothetical protein VGV88_13955 [Candidatus Dormibacteraeota bacterium]|nr:hypothetical protein [Candidatus Dormibacteraeota bacterium]
MGSVALDVRRLAALDMAVHGKRFIVIEFGVGVAGCLILGALSVSAGRRSGVAWELLLGLGLLWIALNYVPLLIHAIDLARSGTARQEAANEIEHPELIRRYTFRQLWILVPLAVVIMDVAQRTRSRA